MNGVFSKFCTGMLESVNSDILFFYSYNNYNKLQLTIHYSYYFTNTTRDDTMGSNIR